MRAGVGHDRAGRVLEHPDELPSDDLALLLGIADPGERVQEAFAGIDDDELHPGRGGEVLLDLLRFALAQKAVVDEDAGELIADRTLHQSGGHRGIDAAGQPADDAFVADRRPDRGELGLDDVVVGPVRSHAGDVEQEVLEDGLAVLGVQHLGVELDPGQAPVHVLEGGDGRTRGGGDDGEARAAAR